MVRPIALVPLLVALAGGCATDTTDDAAVPREASGPLVGRAIEFALEPGALEPAAVDAIAKHLEATTAAENLSVSVKQSDDEGATVVIEAWGRATIGDDALVAGLRQGFPALKNAMIAVKALAGEGPAGRLAEIDVDPSDDPEVVRQHVITQLRADGVQGDVQVHVDDDDDGRREVRVEIEDRKIVAEQ